MNKSIWGGKAYPAWPAGAREGFLAGSHAPRGRRRGDDSDRFAGGKTLMIFSADGGGSSPSFAFPFIISAFIIMKRTPELIKVWANRVTGESGGHQCPGRPGKVSSRKDTNLTPNPINLILRETIGGSFIWVDWRISSTSQILYLNPGSANKP